MVMDGLFLVLAGLLTAGGAVWFYRQRSAAHQKPRIVTWYGWAIITAVTAIAIYSDGHYPAAMVAGLLTFCSIVIGFILARGKGTQFRQIDALVQVLILLIIVLWVFFNAPSIAVIGCILLDLFVVIPVLRHYVLHPPLQLLPAYSMWAVGAGCAALAADAWTVTGVAFVLYFATLNLMTVVIIFLFRSRSHTHDHDFVEVKEM